MKWQRIISLATLAISIFTLFLVLRKPAPVATPASPAAVAANAQSFQEKVNKLEQPKSPGEPESEVHMSAGELTAALVQATGMTPSTTAPVPANAPGANGAVAPAGSGSSASAPAGGSMELPGAMPNVKDYQVSMDGDILRGQFLTQVAGKDVYVTLAGHIGSKDGYATFEATEAKIGDLSIPVSLVNDALQRKLVEQKDQLKLPNNVKDIKVENGELVFVEK